MWNQGQTRTEPKVEFKTRFVADFAKNLVVPLTSGEFSYWF